MNNNSCIISFYSEFQTHVQNLIKRDLDVIFFFFSLKISMKHFRLDLKKLHLFQKNIEKHLSRYLLFVVETFSIFRTN